MAKKPKKPNRNRRLPAVHKNSLSQSQSQARPQIPPSGVRRVVETQIESFSGPIPSPALLREYESILVGSANRLISMAEMQANHRQSLEKVVVEGDSRRADNGLKYGLIVALTGLASAVLLAVAGHESVAMVVGGLDLASLAGVFVYATTVRRAERSKKAEQMRKAIQHQPTDQPPE